VVVANVTERSASWYWATVPVPVSVRTPMALLRDDPNVTSSTARIVVGPLGRDHHWPTPAIRWRSRTGGQLDHGQLQHAIGVLTLTGTGTVAQYQEALRSVTFATTTAALIGVSDGSFVVTDVEACEYFVPLVVTVALNWPPVVTSR